VNEAAEVVTSAADKSANVIFGAVIDESMKDEVRVTVIATGFGAARARRRRTGAALTETAPRPVRERDREREGGFDVPDELLDVPSFLRDS
jgi:cell division protein FtsZ